MKPLPMQSAANFGGGPVTAKCEILTGLPSRALTTAHSLKQRGVVLFLTLIALLAMSLAAVALIRSVDTNTLIAGNLAFKQAAATSGFSDIERAIAWLQARDAANGTKNVYMDDTHTLNVSSAGEGYYSYIQTDLLDPSRERSLTNASTNPYFSWTNADSSPEVTDSGGNRKRVIIQRMCRTAETRVSVNECLFGGAPIPSGMGQEIQMSSDVCSGPGCPLFLGQVPQYRITVRITDPKNSISYVQAYAY